MVVVVVEVAVYKLCGLDGVVEDEVEVWCSGCGCSIKFKDAIE